MQNRTLAKGKAVKAQSLLGEVNWVGMWHIPPLPLASACCSRSLTLFGALTLQGSSKSQLKPSPRDISEPSRAENLQQSEILSNQGLIVWQQSICKAVI